MTVHDSRLHAFRPDLADIRLKGEVAAKNFVAGVSARIAAPVADLKKARAPDAGLNTQLLMGDDITVAPWSAELESTVSVSVTLVASMLPVFVTVTV